MPPTLTTQPPRFATAEAVARIAAASRRTQQPQSRGDLVSLAMGEPDFDTPHLVTEAAHASLRAGRTHYSPLLGEAALREALAEKLAATAGAPVDAGDILITQGGTAGLAASILGIVNPGDKVVVPDPTYSLYADLVSMAGGTVVPAPLGPDLHWDLDRLAEALTDARLFVFCNPSNPTGIVHSREELDALAGLLDGTSTIVISDEAYSGLDYTGRPFTSAISLDALRDRTVYCQTFSKSYAMTGWRVGYLWGPTQLIQASARIHNTFNGSVNTFIQDAALVAVRSCEEDVARMRSAYEVRREIMRTELAAIPGLTLSSPEGAFYQFPRYDIDLPSVEVVAALRAHGVAVRPGSEFGARGEGHLRLSYAASPESITEGVRRLAQGLSALQ
ncbi:MULTISPECIES: aminotransferase class I/II-fold pyridoxal phosphate-dependent enzyme [unclassified Streptomyces]|uniref:pyridoxal phosphate-dependent aminotransferase n=1 Tax=unclassified Streptomyces TaxID=2593676 RepID=UPI002DDBDFD2|nr:aminotransferase class I/II-fold pyridoxal phosphate-dependent enzyme [Streptomyces sp. NBC_01775]WSB74566.1 aminotransferase class I/II-fold pyridoxal phosphate-dependent enzyme [Streptomyces sp. NBC_01775]WSS45793.1 aminotransferase class I/II-fold pyridoxal phosphate-dependent enzyme [Streptomyces sp. NBC_01187]